MVYQDRIHVVFQKQQTWEVLPPSDPLGSSSESGYLQLSLLRGLDGRQTLISLQNDQFLRAHAEAELLNSTCDQRWSLPRSEKLHRLIVEGQRSQSLFDPHLLAELFIKGYGAFVVKILLKLKELLEADPKRLSDYLEMDLETLLLELKAQADALLAQSRQPGQPGGGQGKPQAAKKQTAFSVFDDLEESDSDDGAKEEVKEEDKKADQG